MPILQLKQISKAFGSVSVLNGIDLDIERGEMVCLIGSSGSGKSTLLRCINLLEPIDNGEIWFNGEDISIPGLNPRDVRQRIGIVFQSFNLFPHMTAYENVRLAPSRLQARSLLQGGNRDLKSEIEQLFDRFGLADRMHHYPDQLSGGQQQRVAIVRALALNPEIMLFDEVTSALDPELVNEVLGLLMQLQGEGMTMILATHEMNFARDAADRICMLDEGRIIESGPPSRIFNEPELDRTRAFVSAIRRG